MSKKEQKRLEDLEFESLMGSIGVKKETKAAETAVKVESQTEVDEKKRLANLKKKEKKKAKKVEEVKEHPQPVE